MRKAEYIIGEVYTMDTVTFDLGVLEYAKGFNRQREGRHSR